MTVNFCFSFDSNSKFGLKDVAGAAEPYRIEGAAVPGARSREQGAGGEAEGAHHVGAQESHTDGTATAAPQAKQIADSQWEWKWKWKWQRQRHRQRSPAEWQ